MITLRDTFNNCTVSKHRTLLAAVKAERKLLRAVRRANGESSYIPTEFYENGRPVDSERVEDARLQADRR